MENPEKGRVRVQFHICGPARRANFCHTLSVLSRMLRALPVYWDGKPVYPYIDERILRILEYCRARRWPFDDLRNLYVGVSPIEHRAMAEGALSPDYHPGRYCVATLPVPPKLVIEDCDVLYLFRQRGSPATKLLVAQYEAACTQAGVTCLQFAI